MSETETKKIIQFSNQIGVNVSDPLLVKEALTHRSFLNEANDKSINHNERLEFLGDAVLELSVTEYLFKNYPNYEEGLLTSFRAAIVKTESLSDEAQRLNIGEYIYMSKGEEATGGRKRQYILANTFEALLGAIYLDQGYKAVNKFIIKNVCYKLKDVIENRLDIDAKSKFQEIAQEDTKITPQYILKNADGPDHDKVFEMAVVLEQFELATGKGKSKQEAEQAAAQAALDDWKNLRNKYFG